jgi:hypothetical protein
MRSVAASPAVGDGVARPLSYLMARQPSRYPTEESVLAAFTTPLSGFALPASSFTA